MVNQINSRWKRVLISVFILFHLYIMAAWGLPGSTFRFILCEPINDYVIYTGLWHSWDMFSPDPLAVNFNVTAQIVYQNGASKTWTFPRMEKLGYWERFQKERYRKWRERVRLDAYAGVWDDTARYIARLNDTPTNHPVMITLTREWQPIPTPVMLSGRTKFRDYQPMIGEPNYLFNYRFKFYEVKPGDLAR
jgi:hypothetical protein